MKKLIILAAALLMGWQAQAQIILGAGFIHASERVKYSELENNFTHQGSMNGIYAGASYYYSLDELVDGLAFQPGANLSMLLGHHWDFTTVKVRELAFNVPLLVGYTFPISETVKLFGQTGPSLQVALAYKAKDQQGTTWSLLNKNNTFGESRNRFNLYWGLSAGAEVNENIRFELGWDLGLLNMSADKSLSIRRGYLHLGVGYLF